MSEADSPFWVRYAVDFFLLAVFLYVLFFVKPATQQELDEDEEEPNPLEKILQTDEDGEADASNDKNEIP